MAIWRQQLKRLQTDRGCHDNGHNEQYAIWVCQRERKPQQGKSGEMLNVRAGKRWTETDWR